MWIGQRQGSAGGSALGLAEDFNYHVTLRIFGHLIHLIVLETVPLVTLGLTSFCSEKNCSNSSAFAAGGGRFLGKVFA